MCGIFLVKCAHYRCKIVLPVYSTSVSALQIWSFRWIKKKKLTLTNGCANNRLHGCEITSGCQSVQWIYLNCVEVRKKQKLSVVESDEINCFGILFMFVQEYLGKLKWHDLLVQTNVFSSERPQSNSCEISFFLTLKKFKSGALTTLARTERYCCSMLTNAQLEIDWWLQHFCILI